MSVFLKPLRRSSEGTAQLRFGDGGYYVSLNLEPEVEFGLGRTRVAADECPWDYRPYRRRWNFSRPSKAQRAHIRRWLAGEDSESEDADED